MELTRFLNILKKHRFGIIIIPLLVIFITFMLTRKLPNVYVSKAKISAGIADATQKLQLSKDILGESKVNQAFTNLLQMMQLKVVYDQVSYQLIIHDLTSKQPFRPQSKLMGELNANAKQHALDEYTRLYNARLPLSVMNRDHIGMRGLLKSMGYDDESLRNKMVLFRVDNSDFVSVEFESENPELSAFIVNTYCKEFITYYFAINKYNEAKAITFLNDLRQQKKDSLNAKMDNLKDFKIKNRVLNLNEQAKSLYGQIADFETRKGIAEKEVIANTGAIQEIERKFNGKEKEYLEAKLSSINKEIVADERALNDLNDEYIRNKFDELYKVKIDSLKDEITAKINQAADKYISSPQSSKDNLVSNRLKLEIELELAKNSIKSYEDAIEMLNKRLDILVPNEAVIQAYESDVKVASEEYIDILNRYNQSSMEFSSSTPIKQIEFGVPGDKQPSKKIVLVALSGIVSFAMYMLILFVLFYLDDSIKIHNDLAIKTNMRVLGFMPVIKSSFLDIQKLWSIDHVNPVNNKVKKIIRSAKVDFRKQRSLSPANTVNLMFKNSIRSTRFEVSMAMRGGRNLVVTSLEQGEGKTLFSLSLASVYQMMNKKVLLIDGNFLSPDITEIIQPKYYIEDYLRGLTIASEIDEGEKITVLGNKGIDMSLFEIENQEEIEQKLLELRDVFEIVIIEASALNTLNQSKEWIVVGSRVLAVFEANTSITNEKKDEIAYLKTLDDKFIGWVLNKVTDYSTKKS